MSITWIITANASVAKIYVSAHLKDDCQLIRELLHPEARLKEQDLVTDRPGHYKTANPSRGAFVGHNSHKETEKDRFAKIIVDILDHGFTTNEFSKLILTASPAFLGHLKTHIPSSLAHQIKLTIAKDFTYVTPKELLLILDEEYQAKIAEPA